MPSNLGKGLVDKLRARQQRLFDALTAQPEQVARQRSAIQDPEARMRRLREESAAIDAAFTALAEGDTNAALELLKPYADGAQDARTLTTLARIRSMQGAFDEALGLLKKAEVIDPADPKVLYFTAEYLKILGRHAEEVQYRRREAFTLTDAPPEAFIRLITAIVKAAPSGRQPPLSEIRLALRRIRDSADLDARLSVETACAIFAVPKLADEARALYLQAEPLAPDEHEIVADWYTLPKWCRSFSAPLHRLTDFGEPGRRPSLVELRDVTVLPSFQWLPLADGGKAALSGVAPNRVRLRNEDPRSPLMLVSEHKAVFRLPKQIDRIDEPLIVLGGSGSYYHDIVEYFGALAVPETLGVGSDRKLLVAAEETPHRSSLFQMLGIAPERLLSPDSAKAVQLTDAWFPTRLVAGGRWIDRLLPQWYRQRLAPFMSPDAPHRKLYLSRGQIGRRRIVNEDEVLEALAPLGFTSVRPETLSMQEQVKLFSQASHIVGSAGAAFTNMLFAPPGARVVLLQNPHAMGAGADLYFDALAEACGHRAHIQPCVAARVRSGERVIDADLKVDCERLVAAIQ